jgi:predicted ArsR family transcriptional regulator
MSELVNCFSHVNKRRLLNLFLNECWLTITDCEKVLGINRKLVFAHLSELYNAGLIEKDVWNRKNVIYYIEDDQGREYIRKVFDLLKINDEQFESDLANYNKYYGHLAAHKLILSLAPLQRKMEHKINEMMRKYHRVTNSARLKETLAAIEHGIIPRKAVKKRIK